MQAYFQEQKKRACWFCTEKKETVDYKEVSGLKSFLSEWGKIVPRRTNGNCARHQRQLTRAIHRARHIALMPFSEDR